MTIRKPTSAKTSRFDKAEDFATNTPSTKAKAEKKDASNDEIVRFNFQTTAKLRSDVTIHVAKSKKFKTMRDFVTQAIEDALIKYEGK